MVRDDISHSRQAITPLSKALSPHSSTEGSKQRPLKSSLLPYIRSSPASTSPHSSGQFAHSLRSSRENDTNRNIYFGGLPIETHIGLAIAAHPHRANRNHIALQQKPNMNNPNPGSTSGDGGFLPPTPSSLLSPAPSSTTGLLRSNRFLTSLPHPRHQPIRPNSSKEFTVREYATSKLSLIARRFVKKFSGSSPGSEIAGYNTFAEVCTDFDAMINILWLSGTRTLFPS